MDNSFEFDLDFDEFEGLKVFQGKKGWRFGEDSIHLAQFCVYVEKNYFEKDSCNTIIDIGTGCGIILLLVLRDIYFASAFAVDIDRDMVLLARKNFIENGSKPYPYVILADARVPCFKPSSFDVIVSNPPYIPPHEGKISMKGGNYPIAKWEIKFDLKSLANTASYLLRPLGRIYTVYPVSRLGEVLSVFFKVGLQPVFIRFFHHSPEKNADFFLLACQKNSRKRLEVIPPIYKER